MAKKTPTKKAPKALLDILKNAKKPEIPPAEAVDNRGVAMVLGKGIKGAAIEAAAGQPAAILTMENDGDIKQVSMTTPFGRPALEPGQNMPFLLNAEDAEGEALVPATAEDNNALEDAWAKIAEEEASTPAGAQAESEEEENPFAEPIKENDAEEPVEANTETVFEPTVTYDPPAETTEPNIEELMEEMADLRKQNRALREDNQHLSTKKGVNQIVASLKEARNTIDQLAERENNLRAELKTRPKEMKLPEWEGKDLRVLFPCYKTTNPATAAVLVALALDFGKEKIGFIPGLGDARIANSRNRLANLFLETGATWSLWLDDDMIPTVGRPQFIRDFIGAPVAEVPDRVLEVHVVQRLMTSGHKLIGATYFGRRKYSPAMFKDGIDNPTAYQKAKNVSGEILATDWVAAGCLLVHRDVFLGIQKTHPELAPTGNRKNWDFFQEGKGEEEGEDVMFCRRAKKAGFQPYVDTGAQCFHVGFMAYGFHNTDNVIPAAQGGGTAGKWW